MTGADPGGSPVLSLPLRSRAEAALDLLIAAAREMLTVVELLDDGGVPPSRNIAAQAWLRRALKDAETLRGRGDAVR